MEMEVNFDVLNTLYLIKESLGNSYLDEDFNPFGENFVLNKNSVKHFLEVKTAKKNIVPPAFVDKSEKEIISSIKIGTINTQKLLESLEQQDLTSVHLQHIVVYLKIRQKLLSGFVKKPINYEELVDVLQTLEALDKNYALILKNSFQKNFDVQVAIKHFLQLCNKKQQAHIAQNVEKKEQQKRREKEVQQTILHAKQIRVNRAPKKQNKQKEEEMSM